MTEPKVYWVNVYYLYGNKKTWAAVGWKTRQEAENSVSEYMELNSRVKVTLK